jgi:phosphoribosyl-ATP pyrophosphohydrolase
MATSEILDRLAEVIEERRRERPEGSYVTTLLDGGLPAIAAKVREESEELIEAAAENDADHTAHEAADLLFHVFVMLAEAGVEPSAVYAELDRRFGTGGLVEKRLRNQSSNEGDPSC